MNVGVIPDTATYQRHWWGEGEVKFYLDGDTDHPTLCGTGVEDYIGTAWGQGRYDHAFQGCLAYDNGKLHSKEVDGPLSYDFYRLHLPDPVFLQGYPGHHPANRVN